MGSGGGCRHPAADEMTSRAQQGEGRPPSRGVRLPTPGGLSRRGPHVTSIARRFCYRVPWTSKASAVGPGPSPSFRVGRQLAVGGGPRWPHWCWALCFPGLRVGSFTLQTSAIRPALGNGIPGTRTRTTGRAAVARSRDVWPDANAAAARWPPPPPPPRTDSASQ